MEEKLLQIFKLADTLNNKQNKVYAQIKYSANDSQKLEISIISKLDYTYIEKCQVCMANNPILKWDNIIILFENYINGGVTNE